MQNQKYEIILPIIGKNLVNLSNSVLRAMGAEILNNTLEEIDNELKNNDYKNIVLLLYDGMGSSILDKYLSEETFLQQNKICNISSVFPATTVAATTSILTGLEPCEHGWLGWDMYFKDDNETVSVYMNVKKDTNIPAKHNVKHRAEMKYKSIIDKINKETKNDAYIVWPFDDKFPCNTLEEINNRICELCKKPNKKFIYAYYNNPDKILHQEGFDSNCVEEEMNKINDMTENLYNEVSSGTLIVVIADHGHIECQYETIKENEELFNMLQRNIGLEARTCALTLKSEVDKSEFEKLFLQLYGDSFILYSREEVRKQKLFGTKKEHILFEDNIGDYLAVATKDSCLRYDENGKVFKTYHAGITKDEMEIPLIVLRK